MKKNLEFQCPHCYQVIGFEQPGHYTCPECSGDLHVVFIQEPVFHVTTVEELKREWKSYPEWHIENTTGFEAYHDELLAWRIEYEAECDRKNNERLHLRHEMVMDETGITDFEITTALYTFSELEHHVKRQTENLEHSTEFILCALTQTQVRATLLQAAQLKRIADALERIADGDVSVSINESVIDNSAKIWGAGS